jgi:phosphoribosylglycinamide formyltransferase-1
MSKTNIIFIGSTNNFRNYYALKQLYEEPEISIALVIFNDPKCFKYHRKLWNGTKYEIVKNNNDVGKRKQNNSNLIKYFIKYKNIYKVYSRKIFRFLYWLTWQRNSYSWKEKNDNKFLPLEDFCIENNLPFKKLCKKYNLSDQLTLLKQYNFDLIITCWAWKIHKDFVNAFNGKLLNFHFELLPDYGGGNHFAPLINREKYSGITAQYMAVNIDEGNVLHKEKVPIFKHDTPEDVERKKVKIFPQVIKIGIQKTLNNEQGVKLNNINYYYRMPKELYKQIIRKNKWRRLFGLSPLTISPGNKIEKK